MSFGLFCLLSLCLGGESSPLEQRLAPLAQAHKGKVAIAVKHLKTGQTFFLNADEPMPTASLIKLAVMIETYQQEAEGKIKLTDLVTLHKDDKVQGSGILTDHFSDGATFPLRDAVHLMIVYSDNTATNLVLDKIGIASTGQRMEAWGFPNTKINAKVFKGSTTSVAPERTKQFGLGSTTAREMISLLEKLDKGEFVSPAACKAMLEHMKKCEDKDKFTRFLPEKTIVAHKTGSVSDARTDAGILYLPSGPVALCVLTAQNEDKVWKPDNAGNLLCAKVAKEVYDYFSGVRVEGLNIGPIMLGDLYGQCCEEARNGPGRLSEDGGPRREEIVKALNECKIHIQDTRINEKGKWLFADRNPKALLEGTFSWTLKGADGQEIEIYLKEVKLALNHTNYDHVPPIRQVILNPGLEIRGPNRKHNYYFFRKADHTYDIDGKLR